MIDEKTKIFLIAIAGGIIGIISVIGMIFGFFIIMNRLHTVEITCLSQKEIKKGGVTCEILEMKDRGNILKVEEMTSPPTDETELKRIKDIKTDGKLLEVKIKIKNSRKETLNYPMIYFIDQEKRKFPSLYEGRYWLPEDEGFEGNIFPGIEKEFAEIFEVPKDAKLSKLKIKFSKTSPILD